jgi:hypothetical protein
MIKKTTWHYGLIFHDDGWWLHEIYEGDGELSWTEDAIDILGDSVEDVLWVLKMIKRDIKRGMLYSIVNGKLVKEGEKHERTTTKK